MEDQLELNMLRSHDMKIPSYISTSWSMSFLLC